MVKVAVALLFCCLGLFIVPSLSQCTTALFYKHEDLYVYEHRPIGGCYQSATFRVDCPLEKDLDYSRYSLPEYTQIGDSTIRICRNDKFTLRISIPSDNETIPVLSRLSTPDIDFQEIYLDGLGISKISNEAFKSQGVVKVISLKRNKISEIGDRTFSYITSLRALDLSENEIKEIRWEAFRRVPLQELYLSRNRISHVPDFLSELNVLDVSHNTLKEINPSVLFNTTIFNLSDNQIAYINISCFHNIRKLNMANNKLKEIPVLSASGQNLTELNLSNTGITIVPVNFFRNMSKLIDLDVSRNRLSTFVFGTFDDLQDLKYLNISHNKLETLPVHTFYPMKNLTELCFQNNYVSDLDISDLLIHLPKLEMLDLRDNPWPCRSLLNIIRKLHIQEVSIRPGTVTGDTNMYGVRCSDESAVDVGSDPYYNVYNSSTAYAALFNYFNKEFKKSEFVKYLQGMGKDKAANDANSSRDLLRRVGYTMNETLEMLGKIHSDNLKNNLLLVKLTQNAINEKHLNSNNTLAEEIRKEVIDFNHAAELRSNPDTNVPVEGNRSVLLFMAVLLTIITLSMAVLGYVILFKIKYSFSGKSDVELKRLMESKPENPDE